MALIRPIPKSEPVVNKFTKSGASGTTLGTNFVIGNKYVACIRSSSTSDTVEISSGATVIDSASEAVGTVANVSNIAFTATSSTVVLNISSWHDLSIFEVS